MAETIIGRHQEQHFWKSICAFLFMFFFCACHLNAQEVVTMQQLEGTKWQMKEPNNKNVDTHFEFSDRYITCISDVHYPDTKFRKGLKHKYINKYLYYLADKASTSFDKNEVGQSTKGTYILQELNGGVFWFQICEYTSTKLVLKNKLGQTLTFKKQ